jgi:hypothetical protein
MKRPDRFLVRPHVDAFADLTPIDESTLIERSQLLDAIEMRPESANLETPDEIIAMIASASGTAEEPLQRIH